MRPLESDIHHDTTRLAVRDWKVWRRRSLWCVVTVTMNAASTSSFASLQQEFGRLRRVQLLRKKEPAQIDSTRLPLVLSRGLVEYVLLAVHRENAILEHALPLVLDALDLVIHAEHDVAQTLVVDLVIVLFIIRIVKIGVDGVLVGNLRAVFVVFAVILRNAARTLLALSRRSDGRGGLGRFLERQHEAAALHGLGLGKELLVQEPVDLHSAKLMESTRLVTLHQDALDLVVIVRLVFVLVTGAEGHIVVVGVVVVVAAAAVAGRTWPGSVASEAVRVPELAVRRR
ncbi:hypothetical protein BN1708_005468 [Verticillium longisporum]|uniref:Uncharacterized protein n=1 Tax=Verticillium longisporum TaxID=100787 RepID=A0A0G4MBF5_VERLO|nr:hypothetical protein BN1708_005468 [Verticillium longisporum]